MYAGGIWKGDVLVTDLEELETMDVSEIYSKILNANAVTFHQEKGEFIFPVADGRIKPLGRDQDLRTSTLIRHRPFKEKVTLIFTLGPCQETSCTAIALNPESNFTRREESFPIPLKYYIDVSRTTHTNLMSRKRNASMTIGISMDLETCLIYGQVSLNLLYWRKKLQTDICGPGGD